MPLPKPKDGEKQEDWMDRCMGDPMAIAEYPDQEQRGAVCMRLFGGEREAPTNADTSLRPPEAVRNNYKRGLEMHEAGQTGDGIEEGTIRVARDIAAGETVTEDWVRKANRWWGRNERLLDEPKDSPAFASAMLWGGAAGRDWYRSKAKEIAGNVAMNFAQGEQVRVNVRCNVVTDQIRREQRDGRDVVVVPSYTLPDNIVMNGILYPADEIAKSYKTLEGTPAPLGHPTVNNMFVPARSPLGLNIGYFGAWNANVTRVDGRVFVEKVIDVERANESAMGRRVLAAIAEGKPINTSTGLLLNLRECTTSDLADWEGYDMEFDHDAILLDERGAATPEQGVGMLVNEAKVQVINSDIDERMDDHIDMLGMELLAAIDRKETASRWEQIKQAIMEALSLGRGTSTPKAKEAINMAEGNEGGGYKELAARMDKIEEKMNAMDEAIQNMGKKTNAHEAVIEAINADRKAEKDALVNAAVEAEILSKDDAEATPIKALKALVENAKKEKPVPAPGIAGGFQGNQGDNVAQFSPLGEAKGA